MRLRNDLAARAVLAACAIAVAIRAQAETAAGLSYDIFDGSGGRRGAPIVMVLHGGGGSGGQIRRNAGFDRWAAAAGVVAVYPSAPGRLWNDGRWGGAAGRPDLARRDDVAALLTLAAAVAASGHGDADRLYIVGHSNGGGMAMRIACAAPDRIAGIAVVATKVLTEAPCEHPAVPVPALFVYGTADPLNPHAGRTSPANPRDAKMGLGLSGPDSIALWSRRNACAPAPVRTRIDPAADGVSVTRMDYTGCAAPLRYFEIEGAGHNWPGARDRRVHVLVTREEAEVKDIDAGQEIMRFFFSRP